MLKQFISEKFQKKDYKSPYEKKKEAEMKRLDRKIEKTKETMQREEQLLKMKQLELKEQQLSIIKEEIRSIFTLMCLHTAMHLSLAPAHNHAPSSIC